MLHVTPEMATAVASPALVWYADLLARGLKEFTTADFQDVPDRRLRYYIAQIRQGWCDIRVVKRGTPTVYGLPLPSTVAATSATADTASAAAEFAASWSLRPEAATAPCSAGDYQSLRAYLPADIEASRFERALTSKLIELSGSDLPAHARPAKRLAWLRIGLERVLKAMAPAEPPSSTAPAANTQQHILGMPLPLDPPDKRPRSYPEVPEHIRAHLYDNMGPPVLRYPPLTEKDVIYL